MVRAARLSAQQKKVTFKDVAGVEEAKEELQEIIEFLREPQKFQKLGGRIPKGVLLMGSPGTGKTLLARAIAGEQRAVFLDLRLGLRRDVRRGRREPRTRLFEQGKKNAPRIIFIDEIMPWAAIVAPAWAGGMTSRNTLNQLLVEMDGFESNEGVILLAATNRRTCSIRRCCVPAVSTAAWWWAARTRRAASASSACTPRKSPSPMTWTSPFCPARPPGFAGAELANLVNEAALKAARQNRKVVTHGRLPVAKDKVLMGRNEESIVISEGRRRRIPPFMRPAMPWSP